MTKHPWYVPDFKIAINGEEIPEALRSSITSVIYQDGTNAADRVEVEFANTNLRWLQNHIRGLGFRPYPTGVKIGPVSNVKFTDQNLFDIDNKLSLALGYAPDPPEKVFLGEITGIEADFPSSGMPTMKLVAHDYLNRLARGSYARGFGILPDFLIAAILSAENLLIPLIDPGVGVPSLALTVLNDLFEGAGTKQKGQTNMQLLQEIATRYDADFWVEGEILYLSRLIKEYEPRLTLVWGESLLEFSPQVKTIGQVTGIAVKFTLSDISSLLSFILAVIWDFDREQLRISILPDTPITKSLLGPVITLLKTPLGSPLDITNSALAIARNLRNKLNNRLTGRGSAIGDPRIRAGAVIKLEGLGPDFSGNYRVASANHVINGGGYRTIFKVRKEIIP
jgi:hypothetical protein